MTDEEKIEAIDALMAMYGGWPALSNALSEEPGWTRYHELRVVQAAKLGVTLFTDSTPHSELAHLWPAIWKPAFWDALQEENFTPSVKL